MSIVTLKVSCYLHTKRLEGAEATEMFRAFARWDGRDPAPMRHLSHTPYVQAAMLGHKHDFWDMAGYLGEHNFPPRVSAQASLLHLLAAEISALPVWAGVPLTVSREVDAVLSFLAGANPSKVSPAQLLALMPSIKFHVEAGLMAGLLEADAGRSAAELSIEV